MENHDKAYSAAFQTLLQYALLSRELTFKIVNCLTHLTTAEKEILIENAERWQQLINDDKELEFVDDLTQLFAEGKITQNAKYRILVACDMEKYAK